MQALPGDHSTMCTQQATDTLYRYRVSKNKTVPGSCKGHHTLYLDMAGPIAVNVRGYTSSAVVETGVVTCADAR